jgi:hypothetical protein
VPLYQDRGGYFSSEGRELLSLEYTDPEAYCGAHPLVTACLAPVPAEPRKAATFRFVSPAHPDHGIDFIVSAGHVVVHVVDKREDLPVEVQQLGIEVRSGSYAASRWTGGLKISSAPLIFTGDVAVEVVPWFTRIKWLRCSR